MKSKESIRLHMQRILDLAEFNGIRLHEKTAILLSGFAYMAFHGERLLMYDSIEDLAHHALIDDTWGLEQFLGWGRSFHWESDEGKGDALWSILWDGEELEVMLSDFFFCGLSNADQAHRKTTYEQSSAFFKAVSAWAKN